MAPSDCVPKSLCTQEGATACANELPRCCKLKNEKNDHIPTRLLASCQITNEFIQGKEKNRLMEPVESTHSLQTILTALLVIAAAFVPTFASIAHVDATPLSFTWSNLIFVLPTVVLVRQLVRRQIVLSPLILSWGILSILVVALDVLVIAQEFKFPNKQAVWGWYVTAFNVDTRSFDYPVPVEDVVFYVVGIGFVLSTYVWLSDVWLSKYRPPYCSTSRMFWSSGLDDCVWRNALAVIATATLVKSLKCACFSLPWYLLAHIIFCWIPAMYLHARVRHCVNWPALSTTVLIVLLLSCIWEATLAVPCRWWEYHTEPLVGVYLVPWNLPIEAIFMWTESSLLPVFGYEYIAGRLFRFRAVSENDHDV